MDIDDIERLPENIAESILLFFIRRAFGQDARLEFLHKECSDEDFVTICTKKIFEPVHTKFYLFAFDESAVEQFNKPNGAFDLASYNNICIQHCHRDERCKSILKMFAQYANRNWFVSYLPDKKHVFDRSSSIEEALIGLELGK